MKVTLRMSMSTGGYGMVWSGDYGHGHGPSPNSLPHCFHYLPLLSSACIHNLYLSSSHIISMYIHTYIYILYGCAYMQCTAYTYIHSTVQLPTTLTLTLRFEIQSNTLRLGLWDCILQQWEKRKKRDDVDCAERRSILW